MLAGGKGTRLYPISTEEKPKQFLNLLSNQSILKDSIDRIKPIFSPDSIFINSIDKYKEYVNKLPYQALIEPYGMGTTASVFFIVLEIMKRYKDCAIVLIPSDHYIGDDVLYRKTLNNAIDIAIDSDDVVLIGIKPDGYETGYGYINHRYGKVIEFKEKPNHELAKKYVMEGHLWNSGIFVFKTSVMYELYKKLQKDIQLGIQFSHFRGFLDVYYKNVDIKPDNFEKSILEKTNKLSVVTGNFEWSDIGDLERYKNLVADGRVEFGSKNEVNKKVDS